MIHRKPLLDLPKIIYQNFDQSAEVRVTYRKIISKQIRRVGGRDSTEVVSALLTQPTRVWFPAFPKCFLIFDVTEVNRRRYLEQWAVA